MLKQWLFAMAFLVGLPALAQNPYPYFLSNPCLSPDGQTLVFSFEGDLWKADMLDYRAVRLTAMQGYETNPRISPDGKWIAFTGRQYGNADVFVMPINGGDVKQITFHGATDDVNSWTWDSKDLYFTSTRMGPVSGYKISLEGGTPQRVFGDYYFQYDHHLIAHPANGELFFSNTWESSNQVQRKRYKGPFNPDIQSYHFGTKKHKQYTNWEGKDFGATIDKNGNIYFVSDEANGEYNLYTFENGKKKSLTSFSTSIKTPQVNANGGILVFEKDYQLWAYQVKTGKTAKLPISLMRNDILPKEKDFDVKGNITAFDVSGDGKKLAFVSRGEVFVSDIDGKFIQQAGINTGERVKEVKWMSDNKTLLYSQTREGYSNFYTQPADGVGAAKQITNDQKNNRYLEMNKGRTKAVYLSGRDELRLLDLKTMESKTIVKDEFWHFQNSAPRFSPNDEYVLFTVYRNFEQDILIYNIRKNETTNLTNTGVSEIDPYWSADGKYLFFTSQRLKPAYPFGMTNGKVYRLPLEKIDEPYRMDKFSELFKEEKKDTAKKTPGSPADSKLITIDMDLIMERLEMVSPFAGSQFLAYVYQKADKTTVLYSSNHGEGRNALWKTVIEPFEQNKTEKISGTDGSGGVDIAEVSDKLYILLNGTIHKLNLEGNKVDPVNISYTFRRNLREEFNQLFSETWAHMEEGFYDENFHGVNWQKIKENYRQFLPFVSNRSDLRVLLNDMLGELNSSHQGFSSFGEDETIPLQSRTMETGIFFEKEDPLKVKYLIRRSAADRKGVDIQPGDVLIKVNEETVNEKTDRNYYFTKPSLDRELKLTFSRKGQIIVTKIHPQASLSNNLYDEWIDNNQKKVDEKSKGRIAYGYMKNMGLGELDQFIIDMTRELNDKQALILDLRYNTGGNVHDEVLKFLSQKIYLKWKHREGKLSPQSNFSPSDKPIVLLINEQSLSDAEMTAEGFRALKLGKIIGTGTYRWIIFTSGVGLVDGSFVRMPAWGCYGLDGRNLEMTGVQPDIVIKNSFEDKINGRDPQLDAAIEEILKQLK
jgi:tricorn protease